MVFQPRFAKEKLVGFSSRRALAWQLLRPYHPGEVFEDPYAGLCKFNEERIDPYEGQQI